MSTPASGFPVPFGLVVQPMQRLLLFNLSKDPRYTGIELQHYEDERHGTGLVVLLTRHDRTVDVLFQQGLRLERDSFRVGAGISAWEERDFSSAVFRIDSQGAHVLLDFEDVQGHRVGVHIHENMDRRRNPVTLLAPISADIDHPASLLLAYLRGFDFIQQASRFTVTIDGRLTPIATLPVPVDMHRVYLARYATEPIVVELDRALGGKVPMLAEGEHTLPDGSTAWRDGDGRLRLLEAGDGRHLVQLPFDPPFPDLGALAEGEEQGGRWRLDIHGDASVVAGTWSVRRVGDDVELALDVDQGWKPRDLPPSYSLMTTLMRFFRTWPETYRWRGVVDLAADPPTVGGTWTRSEGHRAQLVGTAHHFELVRHVDIPPSRLWQEVGDFASERRANVQLLQPGDPARGGVGAVREIVVNGRAFRERLVDLEPGRRMQYELIDEAPLSSYLGTVNVEPDNGGSVLRWNVDFETKLPGTAWAMEWLARRTVQRVVDELVEAAGA